MLPIGKRIRILRKTHKRSQFDVCLEMGMAPNSLSPIENGHVEPTLATMKQFANALRLQPFEEQFLYGVDVPHRHGLTVSQEAAYDLSRTDAFAMLVDPRGTILAESPGAYRLYDTMEFSEKYHHGNWWCFISADKSPTQAFCPSDVWYEQALACLHFFVYRRPFLPHDFRFSELAEIACDLYPRFRQVWIAGPDSIPDYYEPPRPARFFERFELRPLHRSSPYLIVTMQNNESRRA